MHQVDVLDRRRPSSDEIGTARRFLRASSGAGDRATHDRTLAQSLQGRSRHAIRGGEPEDESLVGRKIADVAWGIYATPSYIARHGSPKSPEEINGHSVIGFADGIADHKAARWLRAKAPRARICGESGNIPSVLLALKSGAGLAPLPAPAGDNDDELVRVLGPFPELSYPMCLLTHRDLRRMPRVSAFFDFCSRELRPVLRGAAPRGNRAKSRASHPTSPFGRRWRWCGASGASDLGSNRVNFTLSPLRWLSECFCRKTLLTIANSPDESAVRSKIELMNG